MRFVVSNPFLMTLILPVAASVLVFGLCVLLKVDDKNKMTDR